MKVWTVIGVSILYIQDQYDYKVIGTVIRKALWICRNYEFSLKHYIMHKESYWFGDDLQENWDLILARYGAEMLLTHFINSIVPLVSSMPELKLYFTEYIFNSILNIHAV